MDNKQGNNPQDGYERVFNGKVVKINGSVTAAEFPGDEADALILNRIKASAYRDAFSHKLRDENGQAKSEAKPQAESGEDKDFKPEVKRAW